MNEAVLFIGVLAILLVLFAGWYFSGDQRTKRAMRGVSKSTIADATANARVRIVGEVELEADPMLSPLSGRECVYWRVIVEEKRRTGKNSQWVKLVDEQDGMDFLLSDGTGMAYVETSHANAVLVGDSEGGSGFFSDPSPELEAFLAELGHETKGWFFNKNIRYREGVAEIGERVAVVGDARWERDPDASPRAGKGYRDAQAPQRLRLRAPEDGTPLLLSDQSDVMS